MKKKRLIVMGFMGTCPIAGVLWQHLHYIVGLQRLGHEVFYIEDSARNFYNPATFDVGLDTSHCAAVLKELARAFGFEGRWAVCARQAPGMPCMGLTRSQIRELYRSADAILNVCGAQELHDDLTGLDSLIYIESDPGVEQIKVDSGDERTITYLRAHRVLFTFGENIGRPGFPVPLHGLNWLPTRQPVVLDFWHTESPPPGHAVFTTIANWSTAGKKDITWRGSNYLWNKAPLFLQFAAAPKHVGEPLELATDIKDPATRHLLQNNGWRLADPHTLSANWQAYRAYIQASKGEFTVAKDQYVRLHTGWFSDRSACYLAAGRPVITQQTGFTSFYGGQEGLFAFSTPEDIAEAASAIRADYSRHSRAARAIAEEFFAAEKVLASLLNRAGL